MKKIVVGSLLTGILITVIAVAMKKKCRSEKTILL